MDVNSRLLFDYTNWRGERHTYLVLPERFECGTYDKGGFHPDNPRHWVMHADVIERDNTPRPGRRTFLLSGLKNIREIQVPAVL